MSASVVLQIRLPAIVLCFASVAVACAGQAGEKPKPRMERLAPEGQVLTIEGCTGPVGGMLTLQFGGGPGGPARLVLRTSDMVQANHHWGMTKISAAEAPDACISLSLTAKEAWERPVSRNYFIRPDLHFYLPDSDLYKQRLARWSELPPASRHRFRLEIARRYGRVEVAIDGRYFSSFPYRNEAEEIAITAQGGGQVLEVKTQKDAECLRFLPLDLSSNCHQGDAQLGGLSLGAGLQDLSGVPLRVTTPERHIDVNVAQWLRQEKGADEFYDHYYRRSAWDNVPETVIFSVPRRHYTAAHVLCAIRSDAPRQPTMTVRLARYRQAWDGGGGTQADTTVVLDPQHPQGCTAVRQVGTVQATIAGKPQTLPLYLAEVPLPTGDLADTFHMQGLDFNEPTDFFYLEMTRELRLLKKVNHGIHERKPLGQPSGVLVLGVTLEKSPVAVRIESPEPGYVFYKHKSPALRIVGVNPALAARTLNMGATVTDYFGQSQEVRERVTFAPGESARNFDLGRFDFGWHRADFTLADESGRRAWRQSISLALLPPDTRKAGDESPWGTWWFMGNHYTQKDPDAALSLIEKLGFRHTTPSAGTRPDHTPEKFAQYRVTPSMMGYLRAKDAKEIDQKARQFLSRWPNTRWAMVFHETGGPELGIGLPPEVLGQGPPALDDDSQKRAENLWKQAVQYIETVRAVKPGIKFMLGNGGTPFNVHWLRARFPRSHWDGIGMEMAVQLFPPESQPTGWNVQGLWVAKRMREIYGYKDLPIVSCYEFDYRPTVTGALSLERQAEWYARDALHCLAYDLPSINIALLDDCNSAYYFSRWGSTGVCLRAPLMMPKPSFVALATLTRVLDRAVYRRYLDPGSTAAYCLEFERPEGDYAYALWTTTGRRPVHITAAEPARPLTVIDSMGRQRTAPSDTPITVDPTPLYVVSKVPLRSVRAGEAQHDNVGLKNAVVVDPLLDAKRWRVVPGPDRGMEDWCAYHPLHPAKISLEPAQAALKVTLHPQPEVADLVGRYAVLEPAAGPIAIAGRPETIGVWLRGNANWGRVIFEVVDAQGRRWTSNGWKESAKGWDLSDWEGETSINFDGWRLLSVRLPDDYPHSGHYGPSFHQWRCEGDNSLTQRIAYPVKFGRLYLILREKLVYVNEVVGAKSPSIEVRDLTAGGGAE